MTFAFAPLRVGATYNLRTLLPARANGPVSATIAGVVAPFTASQPDRVPSSNSEQKMILALLQIVASGSAEIARTCVKRPGRAIERTNRIFFMLLHYLVRQSCTARGPRSVARGGSEVPGAITVPRAPGAKRQ